MTAAERFAAALTAGPRGRAMCWAFAELSIDALIERAGEEERWRASALFDAAYLLDPDRGTSSVFLFDADAHFGWTGGSAGEDAADEFVFDVVAQPDGMSDEEFRALAKTNPYEGVTDDDAIAAVVRALVDLPLAEPIEELLLAALTSAVDSARYWQAPEGADVAATHPAVRPGLERVARHIAGLLAALDDGLSPAQWRVTNLDGGETFDAVVATLANERREPPIEALGVWSAGTREAEIVAARERTDRAEDGVSGDWWSIPPFGLLKTTRSLGARGPLGLHLVEDSNGPERAIVQRLGAPASARVFEIRTRSDWAELCSIAKLAVTAQKRTDWWHTTGRDGAWVVPDWARIAETYDAVRLSIEGYLALAGRALELDGAEASVIAGWDPDTTYWLTDVARESDEPIEWRRIEPDTHVNVNAWCAVNSFATPRTAKIEPIRSLGE